MADAQIISDVQLLAKSLGQLPEPEVRPAFIVVSGLPGTGKSYFCRHLAERLPFVVLESDALRKTLFSPQSYSSAESSYLFRATHILIEKLLKKGISLILDATNLSERYRERLYHIAERLDARLILIRVEAPPELVRQRLSDRRKNPVNKSDADWDVYQKMKASVQEIRHNHFVVDTSRNITPVLDKIVREVRR